MKFCKYFAAGSVDLTMQNSTRILVTSFTFLFVAGLAAQSSKTKDSTQTAAVEAYVVNTKEQPRKGDMVVFSGEKSKKSFQGRTDKKGVLKLYLPVGDNYRVSMKTFSDTMAFGTLEIPGLNEGEFYSSPFRIDITYEPGRQFTLDNVEFDVGKATLRPVSSKELDELVDYLKWKEEQRIEVAGHTDNVGKDADNQRLSQQRAEAVKNYLVKKGVATNRIIAKGYGATEPVADNATAAGRQRNRRTEVRLLD